MFKKTHLPILIILAIALALRVLAILHYGDFWFDELFSVTYSQKPWLESFTRYWIWETNPPGHMVLLKLWFYIFPMNEFFTRLTSTLAAVASIYALYVFTRKIFNERTAVLSALFLSLASYHIFISATGRCYPLLILLTILSVHYFFKIFLQNISNRRDQIIYILLNILLLYTHLTAVLVLLSEFALLLIYARTKIKNWILLMSIAGICWLPWLIPSLLAKPRNSTVGLAWFFNIIPSWRSITITLSDLFGGLKIPYFSVGLLLAIFALTAYTVLQQYRKNQVNKHFLSVLILLILPIANSALCNLWNIKFLTIVIPWSAVIMAYLVDTYCRKTYVAIILSVLISIPGLYALTHILPLQNWNTINEYIAQNYNPNQKEVFLYTYFPDGFMVNRYLGSSLPAIPYYPYSPNLENWDYNIITKNYYRVQHPIEEVAAWAQLHNLNRYETIFLFDSVPNTDIPMVNYLTSHGWKKQSELKTGVLFNNQLSIYRRL